MKRPRPDAEHGPDKASDHAPQGLTLADVNDLAAVIVATARADDVRAFHLPAVVTRNQSQRLKLIVLAAATAPPLG
jgi:hypothetical protein